MDRLFTVSGLLAKWSAKAASASKASKRKIAVAAFGVFALAATEASAQLTYVTVPPSFNSRSNNMRGPMTSANFQRTAALYRASDMNGLSAGMNLESLGFNIDTAATGPVSGTIKLYLVNSTDNTFNRALGWSSLISTPSAMTLVYDGNLTIPANTGFYDINFTSPFTYTGGSVYMAYEWTTSSPDAESAWYLTSTTLAGGVASAASATALPGTLAASNFRPFLRFGYTPMGNDAAVRVVHALGKVPNLTATKPTPIHATIVNTGTNAISNLVLTLDVTGANTYNTTSTIASLASGDTTVVTFTGFTPTATGATNITVSAPNDDLNTNNSAAWTMTVTDNTISHIPAGTQSTSSVGYGTGAGLLLNKYTVANGQQVYVPRVRVQIGANTSVGKTVFGVVLDAAGNLIGRSADYTISGGDIGTMVTFLINDSITPAITDTDFYIGLAQTASTPAYHPVATAAETIPTEGAYYIAAGAAALTGGVMPVENNTLGRFMMEADLVTSLVSAPESMVSANLSVYPNPNNGEFFVRFGNNITERASVAIVDVTGKTVYANELSISGNSAKVSVDGLSSGLYLLRVTTANEVITKQVVIK